MNAATITDISPVVGGYRVGERLGEGGMGEVYRAIDTMLEREVALKVLRPEMGSRADLVERFRVEAIALARLHHRHIAAVYSFFQQADQHYIAMQYVRGRTLEAVLQQRGALPWRRAAAIATDVLLALDHAHTLGVVHRDLKPGNLMIDPEGRTVVMDFGIARVMARNRQTRAGTLVGTLEYIAPEIVRGEAPDARSDLYSLGCVLYEMVSGVLPFDSTSDFALMRAHAEQAPRAIVRGDLPAALGHIILRALEKQPDRRYSDARAFHAALIEVLGAAPREVATSGTSRFGIELADATRRASTVVRERATAALRWLALPTRGDWAAWKTWAQANFGLASAAAVVAGATLLAVGMGAHRVCCSAPVTLVLLQDTATIVPAAEHTNLLDTPTEVQAPAPSIAPISEPGAMRVVSLEPPVVRSVAPNVPAEPPITRSVRPLRERPASPAPSAPAPNAEQPGWYVKR